MIEEWKELNECKGYYISNLGNIKDNLEWVTASENSKHLVGGCAGVILMGLIFNRGDEDNE